ncbi:ATP-binding domain-containing protein (plasmid) [Paraburkholderia sp. D15]|uniref:3'-5' exonuclease n=1 Tax=Paraburkholderia sp. D15 TaxID=2880218 RepID=UPI002478CFBF|nr:3'-5' exonuclease [Paraburkholderia sp. D15]WGS55045.1 ATP-binding domain-containing protein [Paraburkholderia sp. D15]
MNTTVLNPTDEQLFAIDAAAAGDHLKLKAYAGATKTSTLTMIANRLSAKRGKYLAFNRDIVADAKRKFPSNVSTQTWHSLAYSASDPGITARLNLAKEPPHHLAARYGLGPIKVPTVIGRSVELSAFQVGRMVGDGSARFCRSAQSAPEAWHIPVDEKIEEAAAEDLRALLLPHVTRHWEESADPRGRTAITPDVYLKLWERSRPNIGADFILIDEAQDSDGLMLSVLRRQQHAQVIYAGDPYQQIYEWRGAVNAMEHIQARQCALTMSFRFGRTFAALASRILQLFGETVPVRGRPGVESVLIEDPAARPEVDAVLCRKNVTVMGVLANGLAAGHRVAVRANTEEILAFADGADRLMHGQRAYRPTSLALFESWRDVQEYARGQAGRDLLPIVQLIDNHGTDFLRELLARVSSEKEADYVVSTVHRAKGLEWDRVRVAGDFRFRNEDDGRTTLADDEARLAYVALTRARVLLDVSELKHDLLKVFEDARPVFR